MIRVGVMGCGGMGKKRIAALKQIEGVQYLGVADEARYLDYEDIDDILTDRPDWIIICLPHDVAADVACAAMAAGVNVFMEKPMGLTYAEADDLHTFGGTLFVGMNYRFYPGVVALMADWKAGYFGTVHKVEMVLGHGGKPGDEKTWKLDPARNGGAMLDPGIHLLDLAVQMNPNLGLCFHGEEYDHVWKTDIVEEATAWLSDYNSASPDFLITASIIRWRNTFRIEVHGSDGYGIVERRGGNYGPQSYRRGKRWGWLNSGSHWPEDWIVRQANCESVFVDELRELFYPSGKEPHVCTSAEALETMKLYDRIANIGPCETKT